MTHIQQQISLHRQCIPQYVTLVCVSKFQPAEAIMQAYAMGERDFGESRVQELLQKQQLLPNDIRWHFIGHLQTNKVRMIIPFVHLIHSVDSLRLLECINKEAEKIQRRIRVLLEVHVAQEDTKSGFTPEELLQVASTLTTDPYPWVEICGIMGMATNTDDKDEWRRCFREIYSLGQQLMNKAEILISMGMSDDYLVAIEEGSNMVRIGSSIFGERK